MRVTVSEPAVPGTGGYRVIHSIVIFHERLDRVTGAGVAA